MHQPEIGALNIFPGGAHHFAGLLSFNQVFFDQFEFAQKHLHRIAWRVPVSS